MHTDSAGPGPPLTKRLAPRYWALLDYLAGAVTAVILLVAIRGGLVRQVYPAYPVPFGTAHHVSLALAGLLAILLAAMTGFAVGLRRRRPVFMLGVLLAGSLAVTMLTAPRAVALTYYLPVAYVLYLVAVTYEQRRDAVRVLVAVCATLIADVTLMTVAGHGFISPSALISVALCVIIAWTIGYSVRQRRRYAVRLQDEAASKAVAQERLRIARELHDVVAHSMSVIAVQAGYGQYVIDTQPGDARAALGAIQATSREALDEMRRMLGALRHADEDDAREPTASSGPGGGGSSGVDSGSSSSGAEAPLFPAPGLADLDRLASRTASAGVNVDVKRAGQPRDLPASLDLSAYRIVQEALTNVVKHAQTSSCRVLIGYGDGVLTIEVTDNGAGMPVPEMAGAGLAHRAAGSHGGSTVVSRNGSSARGVATLDGPAARLGRVPAGSAPGRDAAGGGHGSPGGGHGIIGMRERVTLLGGDFSAGPLPGYGFRVSARIPLPANSA
ncbi:MAG TPA: histidine kinase [Streptosporangiaceae bacterium]|nr:histidine kinase [Streptosporangiaceae bacterium]